MRYNEFKQIKTSKLVESTHKQLNEVNMSPSALQSFLNSDLGKQVIAGFEAELDFPDEDFTGEVDVYDNPPIISEENATEFFIQNTPDIDHYQISIDVGNAVDNYLTNYIKENTVNVLKELLLNDVEDDQDVQNFYAEVDDSIQEIIEAQKLFDVIPDSFKDAYERVIFDGNDASTSSVTDYLIENNLSEIAEYYKKHINAYVFSETTRILKSLIRYDLDVLRAATMRDLLRASSSLRWPLITGQNYEKIINKFIRETRGFGYEAGQDRDGEYTVWNFTNDMSLNRKTGIEIVSPAMPLGELLEAMPKFFKWVERNGGTTTMSTGFHMSVSLPNYSLENLDYFKFALFLGDKYILDQFNRYNNNMTQSALKIISTGNKRSDELVHNSAFSSTRVDIGLNNLRSRDIAAFDTLGEQLNNVAKTIVHTQYGKMVSINPKENYVEIRSAGNEDYHVDIKKLQNTLIRYAYALSIAIDPQAEVREYAKKMYQYLSGLSFVNSQNIDRLKLFALYSSGSIDISKLKNAVRPELDDTGKSTNPKTSFFYVEVKNPYVHQLQQVVSEKVSDFMLQIDKFSDYQYTKSEARKFIRNVMVSKLKPEKYPLVKNEKTGKTEPFDPMNKLHLKDSEMNVVRALNY